MIKRFSSIVETLLFIAMVLGIGYASGNPAFIGVHLHPFYIIILLIASRYGYAKSLIAALIAGGTYLVFYFVRLGGVDLTGIWVNCYQPVAYVAFAMFVGLLVEVDKKKVKALNGDILHLNESLEFKQHNLDQVISLNANLSEQLTVTDKTFNIVFRETKGFYDQDIMSAYDAAYSVLSKIIKATKAFVFYLDGSELRLACPKGDHEDSKQFLQFNDARIEGLRQSHECMRLENDRDHDPLERAPLLIGPIIHRDTDTLYGILAIEEMDFLTYNENTFLTFKNLCNWLGDVLYFRLSIQQSPIANVENIHTEFDFLTDYGSSRQTIRELVETFLSEDSEEPAVVDQS